MYSWLAQFTQHLIMTLIIFCLFLILIVGISHGSLDNIKGKKLLKLFGLNLCIYFISVIYLFLYNNIYLVNIS